MAVASLEGLSLLTIVRDGRLFASDHNELYTLPGTILQKLLLVCVSQSRLLCLRNLITNWPLKHLALQNCQDFDDAKAVLLAHCLSQVHSDLRLVDLRGCNIGIEGTRAFCRLAANLPVSQSDVSHMRILDTRPSYPEIRQFPSATDTPIIVLLDCVVHDSNFDVVLQATKNHSVIKLKMSHVSIRELGRRRIYSFLHHLAPDVVSGLDLNMNMLEAKGINDVSPVLLRFTNLTDLNLAYNGLSHQENNEIQLLANVCGTLTKLKKLNLSGNNLKSGIITILGHLRSPLTHLALSGIRHQQLYAMCSMNALSGLKSLGLCTSSLVNCVELLSRFVLNSAETIEDLSIEENMFTTESVPPLCQMIQQLHGLKTLSLCYNHFLPCDIQTFKETFPELEIINRDWLY